MYQKVIAQTKPSIHRSKKYPLVPKTGKMATSGL